MRLISGRKSRTHLILRGLFFLILILCSPGGLIFAGEKTLVYYFKNITGDDSYNDLEYKISVCMYIELTENIGKKRVYIIKPDIFKKYSVNREQYLDERFIVDLFSEEKIDKVLFGYFFLRNGEINIKGRLLSVENGVVIDITEAQKVLYRAIKKVEDVISETQGKCELDKKTKYFSPGKDVKKVAIKEESPISGLIVRSGVVFPAFEWGKYYDPGIFGSFNFYYTPRPLVFPMGLGAQFFYHYLQKSIDSFLGSKLNGVGFQPMLTYIKEREGFFGGYGILLGIGGGLSMLHVNEESYLSLDPSVSANLFLIFVPFKGLKVVLNAGAYSIIYKSYPFIAYTVSVGVKSGTLIIIK